jgi:hypothetical protein
VCKGRHKYQHITVDDSKESPQLRAEEKFRAPLQHSKNLFQAKQIFRALLQSSKDLFKANEILKSRLNFVLLTQGLNASEIKETNFKETFSVPKILKARLPLCPVLG